MQALLKDVGSSSYTFLNGDRMSELRSKRCKCLFTFGFPFVALGKMLKCTTLTSPVTGSLSSLFILSLGQIPGRHKSSSIQLNKSVPGGLAGTLT